MDHSMVIGNHRVEDAGNLEKLEDSQANWMKEKKLGRKSGAGVPKKGCSVV